MENIQARIHHRHPVKMAYNIGGIGFEATGGCVPGLTNFHPDLNLLIAAAIAVLVGVVLWLNSVKEAPILITFFLVAMGFCVPWLLPLQHLNFLTHAAIGLGGVVLGIILGTFFFRFSQAILLAAVVGGILGGGLAYHDGAFAQRARHLSASQSASATTKAQARTKQPHPQAQHAGISDIATPKAKPLFQENWRQKARQTIASAYHRTLRALARLSPSQTSAVWALVVGSALLTLLLALIFPHLASLAGGVWGGSLLMMAGTVVWVDYWRPQWVSQAFATAWPQAVFLLLLVLGTAVQSRHLFKLKAAKKSAKAGGGKQSKTTGEKK